MKLFECQFCGNPVHFDNTACVNCGHTLGYLPELTTTTALEADGFGGWRALADNMRPVVFCDNAQHGVCNWLMPAGEDRSGDRLCLACRHNRTVPDLSVAWNLENWRRIEVAKHHLFYSLIRWRLPAPTKQEDAERGLAFDFKADVYKPDGTVVNVMTGHDTGVITIDIAEADDAERERRRTSMGEPYRALLGHFRHEIGHYYWDRLVRERNALDGFRDLFGDERQDYSAALQAYYANGPAPGWQSRFVSAYASAHPWEDFAETFAHYVHMVDGLETARSYGIAVRPRVQRSASLESEVEFDPYRTASAAELVEAWVPFTVAVNAVNRSVGQPDLYPFVLSEPAKRKLAFVHGLVRG